MDKEKSLLWLISWIIGAIFAFGCIGIMVYGVDPFFHYHKPDVGHYYYELNNERSQNDGIVKHFDYDAMITGTSMTQNFRTSEADKMFGCRFIKASFSGATYKEVNDLVATACDENSNLKIVIRGLDMGRFIDSYDSMRLELGEYPIYLYDKNPFNDIEYLLNKDVVIRRSFQMIIDRYVVGKESGITSFDDYSRWQDEYEFGKNSVISVETDDEYNEDDYHLTDADKAVISKNIELNVVGIADKYPDVDFYYFYTPYSIATWDKWRKEGILYKQLEAEAYITEEIVRHKNIHLFSFNNRTDITTDLNNYKDAPHYAAWISSLILKWMHEGKYQLTQDNYTEYLKQEYDFYTTLDYSSVINNQDDYEADYYAAALLNYELNGTKPLDVLDYPEISINSTDYIFEGNKKTIECVGTLDREADDGGLYEYLFDNDPIGIKFNVNLDEGYKYLCFCGQKISDHGSLLALVYDENGELLIKKERSYEDLDYDIHQYTIDLSAIDGNVIVVLNGGYFDNTGSNSSRYRFSEIYMY